MKRLITMSLMLVVLLAIMTGAVCAAPQVLNHGFYIPAPSISGDQWTSLFLGAGVWNMEYSGGTTLTATTDAATLDPGWFDQTVEIWKFQVSDDGAAWTDLANLVAGSAASVPPATTVVKWQQGTLDNVSTSYVRIGYNAVVSGNNSNASGTAGLVATVVPEPSSAVALATGVVGIIGWIKRRRH